MDYEEFLDWTGHNNIKLLNSLFETNNPLGQDLNCKLLRDFRLYMPVDGMPQAVETYIKGNNFTYIDEVKRSVINLYLEDLRKIDNSGRLSAMFKSIPSQLSRSARRYVISNATGKKKSSKDDELLFNLIDNMKWPPRM